VELFSRRGNSPRYPPPNDPLVETIELFAAPTFILHPPGDDAGARLGAGLVVGVQVPLAEYLGEP
jgi:hypothetical protein